LPTQVSIGRPFAAVILTSVFFTGAGVAVGFAVREALAVFLGDFFT